MFYEKNLIQDSLKDLENKKIYLREGYINELIKYAQTEQVIVVQWQRRSGKSYIIAWLIKKLWLKENLFYFSKEVDEFNLIKKTEDLTILFEEYCKSNPDPEWIIIDEIQDIDWWERFIRARYASKKYKIIISWSNSRILDWELATYLTWRYLNFFVYPLWYKEYLDMNKIYGKNTEDFLSFMELWWLPEIIAIPDKIMKKNYIKNVVDSIILKDVLQRHQWEIRNISILSQLLSYISNIVGSIISIKNISDTITKEKWTEVASATIWNYVNYLLESFIIYRVPRFNIIWKQLFQQKDKYYFNDIWIRNSFWLDMQMDKWKILENIVFLHLKRIWYEVYVWDLNWKEIDFVVKKWDDLQYFQVAWLLTENTEDREIWNLLSIKDGYPKHVISYDALWKSNHRWINVRNIETFIKEFK